MVAEAVDRHRLGVAIDGDADDRLRLLKDSVMYRADRDASFGLRAAALVGEGQEMTVALDNLSVSDPAQRANALEVIESVGERRIVRPLVAMWDGALPPADRGDVLDGLREDRDGWIRACAELSAAPEGGAMTQSLTTLSVMERVLFLRKVPLFAELPPPDLQPIASIAQERSYADGDAIAEQGDEGDEMHIIVSGDVAVVTGEGEQQRVVATRSSGDVVGEMAVITSEPRIAGLVARGPVRVLSIDRRRFEAILRERPETSLAVIRVLCQRLAEAPQSDAGDVAATGTTNAST
jgi:hypothetical protein